MSKAIKKDMNINNVETRKFDTEVDKVLKLMIHSLYTNRDIFLRELLSNASDACDKLRYEAAQNNNLITSDPELKITIDLDKENRKLIIEDNGIGMNKQDLIDNLGTIARSGTQKFLENLSENKQNNIELIGQFGVGFYSSFMVADEVEVLSKKAGEDRAYIWISQGDGEFSISDANDEQNNSINRGTRIILSIKEDEDKAVDKFNIKHIVRTYSDHIATPINFIDRENKDKIEQLNCGSALWTKNKNEISDDEYRVFYKNITYASDNPWMILHNKSEGLIEYTNLLFIPSHKPFDLYNPERKTRVKLYVKKVFITEDMVNLMPSYLRFVKGIIDSEDLPLNISRETLQNNLTVDKIRNSIINKILSELAKKDEKEPEEYLKFWQNFGAVLKEGLCEYTDKKEKILELCKFYTNKSDTQLMSLDKYISNMKDDQKYIYYLSGENIENLKYSPQIEGFNKKDIEVLFLTDPVDDFWTTTVSEYKGKQLKSITESGIDFDNIKGNDISKEKAEDKAVNDNNKEEMESLVKYMKEKLTDKIEDIRISHKLTDSPVCLVIPEGSMSIRMERMLLEQKQILAPSKKILEINPDNKIIQNIAGKIHNKQNVEMADDIISLLLDEAYILEGEEIENPSKFSKMVNRIIEKSLV